MPKVLVSVLYELSYEIDIESDDTEHMSEIVSDSADKKTEALWGAVKSDAWPKDVEFEWVSTTATDAVTDEELFDVS